MSVEKTKTKKKPIQVTSLPENAVDTLAQKYLDIKEREAALKIEKDALNEAVRSLVVDNELSTSLGKFVIQNRKSYSWNLTTLKIILPTEWQSFVVADNKLLRVRAEQVDNVGCALTGTAEVTITEAVTFSKK